MLLGRDTKRSCFSSPPGSHTRCSKHTLEMNRCFFKCVWGMENVYPRGWPSCREQQSGRLTQLTDSERRESTKQRAIRQKGNDETTTFPFSGGMKP